MNSQNCWEGKNTEELYFKLVGTHFGSISPELPITIQIEKEKEARKILERLRVLPHFHGLEIGSGCGYLTKIAAQNTAFVTAVDISESFLRFAQNHCSGLDNVEFRKVSSEDLSFLESNSLDYGFAHSVFIHLNFFEIVRYLKEVHRALKPNGKFWFDIVEIERTKISDPAFQNSLAATSLDRNHRGCLYFNSAFALEQACLELQFEIHHIHRGESSNTSFLIGK